MLIRMLRSRLVSAREGVDAEYLAKWLAFAVVLTLAATEAIRSDGIVASVSIDGDGMTHIKTGKLGFECDGSAPWWLLGPKNHFDSICLMATSGAAACSSNQAVLEMTFKTVTNNEEESRRVPVVG